MFKRIVSSLGSALRRSRFESELENELRDHLEKYRDDLVSGGLSPEEAEFRARREFGSLVIVKEDVRETSGLAWVDALSRNLRFALRMLRKNPSFAVTATLVLALCIGANVAVFAVVDRMLLRPLPYPQPDRLARISVLTRGSHGQDEDTTVDGRTWEYLRDRVRSLALALHAQPKPVNLIASGGAQYVEELFGVLSCARCEAANGARNRARARPSRRTFRRCGEPRVVDQQTGRRSPDHRKEDPAARRAIHGFGSDAAGVCLYSARRCLDSAAAIHVR